MWMSNRRQTTFSRSRRSAASSSTWPAKCSALISCKTFSAFCSETTFRRTHRVHYKIFHMIIFVVPQSYRSLVHFCPFSYRLTLSNCNPFSIQQDSINSFQKPFAMIWIYLGCLLRSSCGSVAGSIQLKIGQHSINL